MIDMPVQRRAWQALHFLELSEVRRGDQLGCWYYLRRDRGFEVGGGPLAEEPQVVMLEVLS